MEENYDNEENGKKEVHTVVQNTSSTDTALQKQKFMIVNKIISWTLLILL